MPVLEAESQRLGAYQLLGELDAGGTGTVYVAKHPDQEGLCAIKIAREELLGDAEALSAFRNGLRIQRALRDQPNTVSTYEIATHDDGRPYAVMPLIAGGTLADAPNCPRFADVDGVLSALIKVARAVQRAHERGVLHCDLKPANVLLSLEGEPFVSDFGLARIVGKSELARGAELRGGTVGWMSPEQAAQQELTTASDVFSLGSLLYWLLSAELPFGDDDDFAERVQHEREPALRARYRGPLAWELEQICARALHKEPELRYRSAAELADDLERARDDDATEAERRRPVRRARKWMRRHKLAALAGLELLLLLLYLPLMPLSVFREVKGTIREQIGFSAVAQAGAVMNELRASARRIEQLALDPQVRALVHHGEVIIPPLALVERSTGFDSLSIFDPSRHLEARWPRPIADNPRLEYGFRDYYLGQLRRAKTGRHEAYVGRPFHSFNDGQPALGVSVPLLHDGEYVGVLAGATRARATFGAVQINCGAKGACMTALLGSRDRDHFGEPLSGRLFVLAAPGMADGQELMLDAALSAKLCARLPCAPRANDQFDLPSGPRSIVIDDYDDPVSHLRSIAALAPVGGTGLTVVVATPNDALDAITARMTERTATFVWVPLLLGFVLLGVVVAWPAARDRRIARRNRS